MDAQTQPWFYPIFVGVLGNASESILVPLPEAPEELLAIARAKGLAYCGMFSLWPREPRSKADVEPGQSEIMLAAVPQFGAYVREILTDRFQAVPLDDSVEWLTKLHSLEDSRAN